MMKHDLLLQGCRSLAGEEIDIAIHDGKIAAIAPHLEVEAEIVIPINGKLVSPPFVESHIHLDSALSAGEPRPNQSGTLFEGIQIWGERKQCLTLDDVKKRAVETLRLQAPQGILLG